MIFYDPATYLAEPWRIPLVTEGGMSFHGGFAGVEAAPGSRKFVVDFKGGLLAQMESDAPIEAVVNVANAELSGTVVERIPGTDIWRLVIDITAAEGAIVELSAHLAGYDRRLTENWLYQWINKT